MWSEWMKRLRRVSTNSDVELMRAEAELKESRGAAAL